MTTESKQSSLYNVRSKKVHIFHLNHSRWVQIAVNFIFYDPILYPLGVLHSEIYILIPLGVWIRMIPLYFCN